MANRVSNTYLLLQKLFELSMLLLPTAVTQKLNKLQSR